MVKVNFKNMTLLNAAELAILDKIEVAIFNNESDVTIRTMAKSCYSSTTTIYRIVKKLGFSGYSEMIYAIKESFKSKNNNFSFTSNHFDNLFVNSSMSEIDYFVQLLDECKGGRIALVGLDYSGLICDYINRRLSLFGFSGYLGNPMDIASKTKSQQDVSLLIVVSKSGETAEIVRIVDESRKYAIKVVSILGTPSSTLSHKSTLSFVVKSNFTPLSSSEADYFYGKTILAFESLLDYYLNRKDQ
ncbi:MAG: MurR/RpiR family transcriptional regulator [Bacilli bacterium]